MPQVRKLTIEEVARLERRPTPRLAPPAEDLPLHDYDTGDGDGEGPWGDTAAYVTMAPRPRLGDLVQVGPHGDTGVVLEVRTRSTGGWSAAEVLVDGRRYLVPAPVIGERLGRPRGITRIDHPSHRTHGWFVRVGYSGLGKQARHTRFFSDRTHGGVAAALRAALAFRNSAERQR